MRQAVLTSLVVMFFMATSDAFAACVPGFRFCPGCSVDVSMQVKSGKACRLSYNARGGVYGQQTLVAPKHGRYGTSNETTTAYLANAGYAGPDYFEVRLYYELVNGKKTFTVLKVNVNVTGGRASP